MSVLLENTSLKDTVAALQRKVTRLESELKRVHARLQALEGRRGVSRIPGVPSNGDTAVVGESEDVQCAVS